MTWFDTLMDIYCWTLLIVGWGFIALVILAILIVGFSDILWG